MSSTQNNYGLEILLHLQKENIKSECDILMIIVHYTLMKNGCKSVCFKDPIHELQLDSYKLNENLPDGWNLSNNTYKLHYIFNDKMHVLYGNFSNGTLNLNLSVTIWEQLMIKEIEFFYYLLILGCGNFRKFKLCSGL